MSEAASGRWAAWARHPFRSWTLRGRLVLAVVALLAALGVVIGLVSVLFLRGYLEDRLDAQLQAATDRGRVVAAQYIATQGAYPSISDIVGGPGQSPGTVAAFIDQDRNVTAALLNQSANPQAPVAAPDYKEKLIALGDDGHAATVDLGGNLGTYRLMAVALPQGGELVVGLPLTEVDATTARLAKIILVVTVIALAVAAAIGLLIVRLALRPLERVASAATEVSTLQLDRGEVALAVRVPESDTNPRTEVGRVGGALNRMLGHVASALHARQASENKVRQFVADASHELRTPLASIRGYAELTRRGPSALPPDAEHAVGRIESEAARMTMLVEDLLLLARLDEGRALEQERVDLSRLLIDVVSDVHAASREHRWSIDLPEEPVEVIGDGPRLHQVFANLLANARVHTPAGTAVTVALAVEDSRAIVTVTDDGPGIPAEMQPVLFERFVRGDSSRSRETGSTGLGLAIVHAVVTAQGGTVAVSSEPGHTQFRVTLAAARESDTEASAQSDAERAVDGGESASEPQGKSVASGG